jgi:hypothetical protein
MMTPPDAETLAEARRQAASAFHGRAVNRGVDQVKRLSLALQACDLYEAVVERLSADAVRLRAHSETLNRVGYLAAEALSGNKGMDAHVGDPVDQVGRLIRERDDARTGRDRLVAAVRAFAGVSGTAGTGSAGTTLLSVLESVAGGETS